MGLSYYEPVKIRPRTKGPPSLRQPYSWLGIIILTVYVVPKKEVTKLQILVKPYMYPSMLYNLG
jgi:hypothetical protein